VPLALPLVRHDLGDVNDAEREDPAADELSWIDQITDSQCMEIFWLYVDPPEPFLASHPPELLGAAMRYALRAVAEEARQAG